MSGGFFKLIKHSKKLLPSAVRKAGQKPAFGCLFTCTAAFPQKPFTHVTLSKAVRESLDA